MTRKQIIVNGRVQGVGFRPFVYRIAKELGLTGWVKNSSLGVVIEIQGEERSLDKFIYNLQNKLPRLAKIVDLKVKDIDFCREESEFNIVLSQKGDGHNVLISPDVCICDDCKKDIFDPNNRRYLYPFTNCTNCGPRYTITYSIPYDRAKTSMSCFPMCEKCFAEYKDHLDRRFHAQPNACPECGPHVWLVNRKGELLEERENALRRVAELLLNGKVIAIKGLGGFHLACDAKNSEAVLELRKRKNRPHKSLAVMVDNLQEVKVICEVNNFEANVLTSPAHPIVVLQRKNCFLSEYLAPDTNTLGVMLPYTPLHFILFKFLKELGEDLPVLVMTSGNSSSEPISLGNREAFSRLSHIADFFLFHNRDILIRCDDSVVALNREKKLFFRRARGYVPTPIFLAQKGKCVLGVGPELKNTICVIKQDQAFVSQHIGDLKNLETYKFFLETIEHLQKILEVKPELIVCDLHPDYLSTNFAQEQKEIPILSLQHHFAHIYSLVAENKIESPVLAWALDGTGLGEDGNLWGAELIYVDPNKGEHYRLATFDPIPLPGGEKAVLEPWRIAYALLWKIGEDLGYNWKWKKEFFKAEKIIFEMLEKGVNCPLSSSLGRFLDGVASLLGLVNVISYEGQGPILLEKIQSNIDCQETYDWNFFEKKGLVYVDTLFLFKQVLVDFKNKVSFAVISKKLHSTLIKLLVNLGHDLAKKMNIKYLGFSGGVMQNRTFSFLLPKETKKKGLIPLIHTKLPPNDGSISLGQAFYGQIKLRNTNFN